MIGKNLLMLGGRRGRPNNTITCSASILDDQDSAWKVCQITLPRKNREPLSSAFNLLLFLSPFSHLDIYEVGTDPRARSWSICFSRSTGQ